MLYPTPRILYIILFLVFGCTSCSSPPAALQRTPTPEAATAAPAIPTQPVQITPSVEPTQLASAIPDESLTQALQLTPVDARSVAFTNWTLAKAYADATDLTGDSNIKKQVDFYHTINQQALDFTLAAGLFIDATVWSFGSVDLLWDARIDYTTTYSQSSHLFKFPSTFDLNPVLAHFDQYGYQQERYGDATLYTRQPDANAPWYNQVPFWRHLQCRSAARRAHAHFQRNERRSAADN